MATKGGIAFDPEQIQSLMEGLTGLRNGITSTVDSQIKPIIAQLRGDEVIGESTSKDALLPILKDIEDTLAAIDEKFDKMGRVINTVGESTGARMQTNIQRTDEAASAIASAAKKAREANGKG